MKSDKEKYADLWDALRKSIQKHGFSSNQANAVRDQMDKAWKEMSAEDQKRFYTEWSE